MLISMSTSKFGRLIEDDGGFSAMGVVRIKHYLIFCQI